MIQYPFEHSVSAELIHRILQADTIEQLVELVSEELIANPSVIHAKLTLCGDAKDRSYVLVSPKNSQATHPVSLNKMPCNLALSGPFGQLGVLSVRCVETHQPIPALQGLADTMALKLTGFSQDERYCALTGLMRNQIFNEKLAAYCLAAKGVVCFGVLSVDHLSSINDSYGHESGDLLLKEIARRMRIVLGDNALIARASGDRFVFCITEDLLNCSLDSIGPRLLSEVATPVSVGAVSVTATASIGMAHMQADAFEEAMLIAAAERALTEIKGAGGNAVIVAHPNANRVFDRSDMTVRNALDHGEITAFLQPIYDAKTRTLSGFEALARWQRPNGDVVGPAEFLEPIRRLGLASKQCRCVVAALRDFTSRCPEGISGLHLSLNLSNHELSDLQLIAELCEWAKEMRALGFVPVIEVNEDTDIRPNEQGISGSIIRLEEASAEISLDDFGTGNGSTSRLLNIPAHYLKIDRRFVSIMHDDPKGLAVIEALLLLARGFGMKAVAEGVESEKDCERLLELGCDLLQGFYFAPAICVEAALKLVGQELTINPRSSLAG